VDTRHSIQTIRSSPAAQAERRTKKAKSVKTVIRKIVQIKGIKMVLVKTVVFDKEELDDDGDMVLLDMESYEAKPVPTFQFDKGNNVIEPGSSDEPIEIPKELVDAQIRGFVSSTDLTQVLYLYVCEKKDYPFEIGFLASEIKLVKAS
jgi:hypothetical protein